LHAEVLALAETIRAGRRYSTQAWFFGAGMKAKISFDIWYKF
jgi:hypothetical protein